MIEKCALADQTCRLFGAAFAYVFWNYAKKTNDVKIIDQRDIGFDGACTHIRNARWVQVREWTTWECLRDRGFDVRKLKKECKDAKMGPDLQSGSYESKIKQNRGLENRVGEIDDLENPVQEIVTEWTSETYTIFLPRHGVVVDSGPNIYKHKQIPVAQLRYYPLGDDIYGESEVECVLPLQRAANAILCGAIDEANLAMRPPLKISSTAGVRLDSIEYGPGAQWIMGDIGGVQEAVIGGNLANNFNTMYPAIKAAFSTVMGDQVLGVSNERGAFTDKTATEVNRFQQMQMNRDSYNQIYLAEFLKDIMMMWLSNNKQFLFDDESKQYIILRIVGRDKISELQSMRLADEDIPDSAMQQIKSVIDESPSNMTPEIMSRLLRDVTVPRSAVIKNPDAEPDEYEISNKLTVLEGGNEAELYITPEDMEGEYDYIPDVASMGTNYTQRMTDARNKALDLTINPTVIQLLNQQGEQIKIKELLIDVLQDAGMRDAEGIFTAVQKVDYDKSGQSNIGGIGINQIASGATSMGQVPSPGIA